jgi:hypothetical protein
VFGPDPYKVLSQTEIIPVEPDQGNACAGKVKIYDFPLVTAFPLIFNYLNFKK